ncbi:MAG: T9SS type A sorting domain-containing protein, partial [Candidatus Zixiibacteriota bacterium]
NNNLSVGGTDFFVDNNNGTAVFSWQPEFIGLYSADGSPFVLNFWVNDGVNSVMSEVVIEVVNKNRKPVITSIDSVYAEPGDILEMSVAADDPDLEPIVWQIIGLPQEAVFDYANPGVISWTTSLADTGVYDITVIASDPQGLTDTSNININLRAVSLFTISLDTVSAFPGDKVDYEIILDNKVPIGSFNILFNYDQSALTLYTVTNEQTRSEGFEYFTAFFDEGGVLGRVRLVGIADLTGGPFMPFLDAGVGPIASISFRIISDVNFSGVSVPVRFLFLDSTTFDDNTLTDSSGNKIEQASIIYNDGYVIILKIGDVSIGDINLNGIQYEVGDVIYFSNFFMNPAFYPLNPLAYANSDVNQDNISATIADLIALINVIVGSPNGYGKDLYQQELTAKIRTEATAGGIDFIYETNFEVGGIFISFFADDDIALNDIINYMDDMTMIASRDSSEVRMLIYSLEGNRMPFGENSFVGIDGRGSISINNIQFATNDGQLVEVSSSVKSSTLPDRIKLYQNYPNPFNPETQIDFELVKRGRVKLTIYNVLGKKVKTIIDNEELTAGIHSAPWDSRNDNSEKVASGIYLYRLETESGMLTRKMMLLK